MNSVHHFKAQHQSNWDARAAANFIGGGAGSGLLLFAAPAASFGDTYRWLALVAVLLIATGLFCVWMEIGRPWRALNVFLHARTSWMTRESLLAPVLLATALWAAWSETLPWIWLTAVFGLAFLYCQARILQAAKGIPAWREHYVVPLIVVTGLTEGLGWCSVLLSLASWRLAMPLPVWPAALLMPLLILRLLLWRRYRWDLRHHAAPAETQVALNAIELVFAGFGHWGAGACVLLALFAPVGDFANGLMVVAGLSAALAGAWFKFCLITRAAYKQCHALPHAPVRGGRPPISQKVI